MMKLTYGSGAFFAIDRIHMLQFEAGYEFAEIEDSYWFGEEFLEFKHDVLLNEIHLIVAFECGVHRAVHGQENLPDFLWIP